MFQAASPRRRPTVGVTLPHVTSSAPSPTMWQFGLADERTVGGVNTMKPYHLDAKVSTSHAIVAIPCVRRGLRAASAACGARTTVAVSRVRTARDCPALRV